MTGCHTNIATAPLSVISLSIALDIRLFLLILHPLSSTLLFARVPGCRMAILVNPARGILFAHCAFDVALSPPRFPAHSVPLIALCLLSYPSSLLLWVWLACCGLKKMLLHRLQTGDALRLSSSTCTKPPNPSTCPSFWTTATENPPKLQKNDLVSGGHGQAGSWRRQ